MTESLSDPTSPVSPTERKGWTRLGLKEPFWVVLGIWIGTVLCLVLSNLSGSPATTLAAFVAFGVGCYFLYVARQSEQEQPWHWMLVGGGSYAAVLALLILLVKETDNGGLKVLATILIVVGNAGCFFATIGMLVYAAAKRPSSVPVAVTPQRQMVAPIIGYSADGTPVYGQPGYLQPQNAGTNVCAILALIFGFLGGLLAIVFGHIALSQIQRTGEQGRGLAIAGLVLGYMFLAFWVIFLIGLISYSVA
ncbi:DUF4190 domain-containing protein [Prescottella agglutinans]|uniref:DUF4190 domain-containing protein n=1 Tax=Prescottella agglutinans TaxID=1644129 RepID=UPI0024737A9F|nr:DUF4190 domain-containing protein [Prescottella agglutinans]